jgi:hypothetical protein
VTVDLLADPSEQDDVTPLIRMLWEHDSAREQTIIGDIGAPVSDLSGSL